MADSLPGGAAFGTPPRPAGASLLATPLSRTAGGKLAPRPSPSLLDRYLAAGDSLRLGATPRAGGAGKADPLDAFLAKAGIRGSGDCSGACTPTTARSGSVAGAREPGSGALGGDFSISALRSAAAPDAALGAGPGLGGGVALSVRLSPLPAAAAAPARLGAAPAHAGLGPLGSRPRSPATWQASQSPLAASGADVLGCSGRQPPPPELPFQGSSAAWAAAEPSGATAGGSSSGCSLLDGLHAGAAAAVHAAPLAAVGGPGSGAELAMLQSRVNELQAQVGRP